MIQLYSHQEEALNQTKDFIYRKKRKYGNTFTTDDFTVKVGDAQ